jgi:hypothetical protein
MSSRARKRKATNELNEWVETENDATLAQVNEEKKLISVTKGLDLHMQNGLFLQLPAEVINLCGYAISHIYTNYFFAFNPNKNENFSRILFFFTNKLY